MDTPLYQGFLGPLVNESKGIKENIIDKYFEFYIAGYTKSCLGEKVQEKHRYLSHNLCGIGKLIKETSVEGKYVLLKPCDKWIVTLHHEQNNRYDKNAIIVKINNEPYGYVPKIINKFILQNLNKIKPGWVKKSRFIFNKFYTTKVAIPWQENLELDEPLLRRMSDILEIL